LRFQIQKRGERRIDVQPEFERAGDDLLIGSTSWLAADGRAQERFQVITPRGGKIADIQGCTSRRHAERFARRQASRSEMSSGLGTRFGDRFRDRRGNSGRLTQPLSSRAKPCNCWAKRRVERAREAPPR
jgi:hypothetical protein